MFNSKRRKVEKLVRKWRERAESHYKSAEHYRAEGDEAAAELAETIGAVFKLCGNELESL